LTKLQFFINKQNRQNSNVDKQNHHQKSVGNYSRPFGLSFDLWHHVPYFDASQCDTRMLDGNSFVLVLQTRPGHVLRSLSHRDLLSLASTCQACKEVICVFLLPQAQDVSAGHETNAVPCSTTLSTVSRAISFCRANDLSL